MAVLQAVHPTLYKKAHSKVSSFHWTQNFKSAVKTFAASNLTGIGTAHV